MMEVLVLELLVLCHLAVCVEACPNTAGVVLGSILGTLAVVAVIGLLIYCYLKRKSKGKADIARNQQGVTNPSFLPDIEAGTSKTAPVDESEHESKGFGGYVECREFVAPSKADNTV